MSYILKSYNFSFLSVGRDSGFSFLFSHFSSLSFYYFLSRVLDVCECITATSLTKILFSFAIRTLYFLSILQVFSLFISFHFNTTQFFLLSFVFSPFFLRSVVFFSGKLFGLCLVIYVHFVSLFVRLFHSLLLDFLKRK